MDAGCRRLTASWVRERALGRAAAHGGAGGEDADGPGGGADGGAADVELCDFFEQYDAAGGDALLPPGVYTARPCASVPSTHAFLHSSTDATPRCLARQLEELRRFGRKKRWCPYFLARHMLGVEAGLGRGRPAAQPARPPPAPGG